MVLLIDHQAHGLLRPDADAPRTVRFGMLAADQLPFHKELSVERRHVFDVEIAELPRRFQVLDAVPQQFFNLIACLFIGPWWKRVLGDVPCEPDPAGNDDVGIGTGASQPLTTRSREGLEIHDALLVC